FACLSEVFGFAKDTFEAMWDDSAERSFNGIQVRFATMDFDAAAMHGAPRRLRDAALSEQLANGPLVDANIAMPPEVVKNAEAAVWRAAAKNRAGGTLLHRVLERWDGVSAVEPLIALLAAEAGVTEDVVTRLRQRIFVLRKSSNFARVMSAPLAGREMSIRFI